MNYQRIDPLKTRLVCDSAYCKEKSQWYAYLDDLVFCWKHADKWQEDIPDYRIQELAKAGIIDGRPYR